MGILERISSFINGLEEKPLPELGRNDQCCCGSGKKYKRCHYEEDEKKRSRQRASCVRS